MLFEERVPVEILAMVIEAFSAAKASCLAADRDGERDLLRREATLILPDKLSSDPLRMRFTALGRLVGFWPDNEVVRRA